MKSKKKVKLFNLTKLYLLKYKIYKDLPVTHSLVLNFLKLTEFSIKQSLNLIYNYHLKNKKILFIGLSYSKKALWFLSNSNHIFLPKHMCFNGVARNNLQLNNTFYNRKPDLIVFFENTKKDSDIIKQFGNLNIPIIIFGDSVISNQNYSILGNLSGKIELKHFFEFLVYSILKMPR